MGIAVALPRSRITRGIDVEIDEAFADSRRIRVKSGDDAKEQA